MNSLASLLSSKKWLITPLQNQLLSSYTSIRSGGKAAFVLQISSLEELHLFLGLVKQEAFPWMVLGKGSNVIFTDEGFEGVILQLSGEFTQLELNDSDALVTAGAGLSCFKFARPLRNAGLSGAEFLSTIPGTLGGAVFMNAGAHGQEIKDIVTWVRWMEPNGTVHRESKENLNFAYRSSRFMESPSIILQAGFKLIKDEPEAITAREKEMHGKRKQSQPVHMPTWGSVFVNPPGDSAGRLIDSLSLKGKGFGDARISPMHANFIENTGSATYEDIEKTILLARNSVYQETGVLLETEVRILNPDGSLRELPEI